MRGQYLFATISAGIAALWGPKLGGANQAVIDMLQGIHDDGGDLILYNPLTTPSETPSGLLGWM